MYASLNITMRAFIIFVAIVIAVSPALAQAQVAAPSEPAATEVKAPAGVDPELTSTDPDYGYSEKKPIKVGSEALSGPAAERAYLRTLRDEAGKPVTFRRLGSVGLGPYGNILDAYEVQTSTGRTITLFIDMYHLQSDPQKQLAPKGLFKAK